jgi:hypothetical protein
MKKEKTMNPALKLAVFFTLAMGAGDVLAEPPAIAPHPTTVEACGSVPVQPGGSRFSRSSAEDDVVQRALDCASDRKLRFCRDC